jgi:hypothetical protein
MIFSLKKVGALTKHAPTVRWRAFTMVLVSVRLESSRGRNAPHRGRIR